MLNSRLLSPHACDTFPEQVALHDAKDVEEFFNVFPHAQYELYSFGFF
jgi:hypothetical protein